VPTADVSRCSNACTGLRLLDHLVGAGEERWGHGETEHLGDPDVNDQLELSRLLDGEVGGLCPLQDLVHQGGSPPEEADDARPVRHQAPRIRPLTNVVHGREVQWVGRRSALCHKQNLSGCSNRDCTGTSSAPVAGTESPSFLTAFRLIVRSIWDDLVNRQASA